MPPLRRRRRDQLPDTVDSLDAITYNALAYSISLVVSPASATLAAGASADFTVTLTRSGGFASPVALVASSLPSGVTAAFTAASLSGGTLTTTMTLTAAADAPSVTADNITVRGSHPQVADAVDTVALTVEAPEEAPTITSVTLSPATLDFEVGDVQQLDVTVAGTGAYDDSVTYESSNPAVASVTSGGLVTGEGEGSATITATSDADPTKSDTTAVTVTEPAPSPEGFALVLADDTFSLAHGDTANTTLTINRDGYVGPILLHVEEPDGVSYWGPRIAQIQPRIPSAESELTDLFGMSYWSVDGSSYAISFECLALAFTTPRTIKISAYTDGNGASFSGLLGSTTLTVHPTGTGAAGAQGVLVEPVINLPRGTEYARAILVPVYRQGGYQGDVTVAVNPATLPANVTAFVQNPVVPYDPLEQQHAVIRLIADASASLVTGHTLQVTVTPTTGTGDTLDFTLNILAALGHDGRYAELPRERYDPTLPAVDYDVTVSTMAELNSAIAAFGANNVVSGTPRQHARFTSSSTLSGHLVLPENATGAWITICCPEEVAGTFPTGPVTDDSLAGRFLTIERTSTAPAVTIPEGDAGGNCRRIRLVGLELTVPDGMGGQFAANFAFTSPGTATTPGTTSGMPDEIIIDRCWVHPNALIESFSSPLANQFGAGLYGGLRRFRITNTFFDGTSTPGGNDTAGISMSDFAGPGVIAGNVIVAGGIPIFFGGGDIASGDVGGDLWVEDNYIGRRLAWKGTVTHPKALIEFKLGKRICVQHNVLGPNYGPNMSATAIMVKAHDANFRLYGQIRTHDICIRHNRIRGVGAPLSISAGDVYATGYAYAVHALDVYGNELEAGRVDDVRSPFSPFPIPSRTAIECAAPFNKRFGPAHQLYIGRNSFVARTEADGTTINPGSATFSNNGTAGIGWGLAGTRSTVDAHAFRLEYNAFQAFSYGFREGNGIGGQGLDWVAGDNITMVGNGYVESNLAMGYNFRVKQTDFTYANTTYPTGQFSGQTDAALVHEVEGDFAGVMTGHASRDYTVTLTAWQTAGPGGVPLGCDQTYLAANIRAAFLAGEL